MSECGQMSVRFRTGTRVRGVFGVSEEMGTKDEPRRHKVHEERPEENQSHEEQMGNTSCPTTFHASGIPLYFSVSAVSPWFRKYLFHHISKRSTT